ncbi:MAG: hypothetical protein WD530_00505, partial [Vicingaceae bacterium]
MYNKLLLLGMFILTANHAILGQSEKWNSLIKNEYLIEYPNNWDLDESGQMGTSFFLFSALQSQEDQFRENVNLLIQDLSGHQLDLDEYVELSEDQIKKMITDSEIIESKRVVNSESTYHKVLYTGKQGTYHLKFVQYYWLVADK